MAEIVNGLFGIDPDQYRQQQQLLQSNQNMQLAKMDPMEAARYSLMQGGTQLGNVGMQLMGVQDPMLVAATELRQIASKYDNTDPRSLKMMAQELQAKYPQQAQQALALSNKLEAGSLENLKTQSEIIKNSGANQTEVMKTQARITQLRAAGDPNNEIPALEDRMRSLVKSDIPASVYNTVIAPQTEKFNIANTNKSELDRLTGMIDNGVLKFGVTDNFRNKLKTISGESTEGSRAAADFDSTLESIRLQAQILQKGSQTDRDAANIMNSFLKNIDKYDTATVRAQLTRISKLMETQAKSAQGLIQQTENYYGGASGRAPAFAETNKPNTPAKADTPKQSNIKLNYSASELKAVRDRNPKFASLTDEQLAAKIDASR